MAHSEKAESLGFYRRLDEDETERIFCADLGNEYVLLGEMDADYRPPVLKLIQLDSLPPLGVRERAVIA